MPIQFRLEDFLGVAGTRFICGFGHDRISDDYKVIEVEGEFVDVTIGSCTQIWVYSLKTKSWTISSPPYFLSKQQISFIPGYGIFAGNALHWIMERRDFNLNDYKRYLIGALDLGADNQFYEVQKPDYCDSNNVVLINLGILDGCLCVSSGRPTALIDVWVMKE
ncbi:F-box protein CPR1-like [Actinidia eriantha]|uniref:F-box protein CPR1-like n=1 Tax=Actinidia eriantha TaxID=165200 RepID=UPI00258F9226|nr:F-box protein CPR1-like [Actinidia eriantha]